MTPVIAMTIIGWILFIVIWVALAFWPARVAGRKGHSFVGYFIFSLFFFPAALITAYVVKDRTVTAHDRARRQTGVSCARGSREEQALDEALNVMQAGRA